MRGGSSAALRRASSAPSYPYALCPSHLATCLVPPRWPLPPHPPSRPHHCWVLAAAPEHRFLSVTVPAAETEAEAAERHSARPRAGGGTRRLSPASLPPSLSAPAADTTALPERVRSAHAFPPSTQPLIGRLRSAAPSASCSRAASVLSARSSTGVAVMVSGSLPVWCNPAASAPPPGRRPSCYGTEAAAPLPRAAILAPPSLDWEGGRGRAPMSGLRGGGPRKAALD